jgi:hypothetical protein
MDIKVRATHITSLMACPRKYEYSYIRQLPGRQSAPLAIGTAVHDALNAYFSYKLKHHSEPEVDDVVSLFVDNAVEGWEIVRETCPKDADKLYPEIERMRPLLAKYVKEICSTITPVLVEKWFSVKIPSPSAGDPTIVLTGTLDLADNRGRIFDHKTYNEPMTQEAANRSLQPASYYLGYAETMGGLPKEFVFGVLCKSTGLVQLCPTSRTSNDLAFFKRMAQDYGRMIESGIFPPNTEGQYCNERFCEFWDICRKERIR